MAWCETPDCFYVELVPCLRDNGTVDRARTASETSSEKEEQPTTGESWAVCPSCGKPGQRLGSYRLDDGRGRYACDRCDIVWWVLIENGGDAAETADDVASVLAESR
jgi:hypothetical protein